MTTKLLALASQVFPNKKWKTNEAGVYCDGAFPTGCYFDPRNNDAQAWAVLAWLLTTDPMAIDLRDKFLRSWTEHEYKIITHDGTPAGLRNAVTDAGERVVG